MAADTRLARAQQKYVLARFSLLRLVKDTCPGDHEVLQHRDGLPAWCVACRRDRLGRTVETLAAAKEREKAYTRSRRRAKVDSDAS